MPTRRFQREFESGSKPTPDPFDQFLDENDLYRKHVPREPSSLFRVIAEQVYNAQEYHEDVRKDCVNYMIKNRKLYENKIDIDFMEYTRKMAEICTPGTLLELKSMAHMYQRNILLYQPFELGNWFVKQSEYKENPLLRVFSTKGGHFDLVYTKNYMVNAGFCQSIVYEILYKNVFKLPDIEYSVEVMLHNDHAGFARHQYANNDEYASSLLYDDGREFHLDRPEDTECILNNRNICRFHNPNIDETTTKASYSCEKPTFSNKYISCVRQLLNGGIPPFPYKAAKALDPDMYRNVEFDSWSEKRNETILKYGWNLQVGEKCLVSIEGEKHQMNGYIQEIDEKTESCIVYVDELNEKRSISMSCMHPAVNAKPYDMMYMKCGGKSRKRCVSDTGCKQSTASQMMKRNRNYSAPTFDSYHQCECDLSDAYYTTDHLKQFTDLTNFVPIYYNNPYQIFAYPIQYTANAQNMAANPNNSGKNNVKNRNSSTQNQGGHGTIQTNTSDKPQQITILKNEDDKTGNGKQNAIHVETKSNDMPVNVNSANQQLHLSGQQQNLSREHSVESMNHLPANHQTYRGAHYYYPQSQTYDYGTDQIVNEALPNQQYYSVAPNTYQTAPIHGYATAAAAAPNQMLYNYVPVQYGQWPAAYNAQGYVHASAQPVPYTTMPAQMPFMRPDLLITNGRPNYQANYSSAPMGEDLPMQDIATLRFYYNLGIEYWKQLQSMHGFVPLMAMMDEICERPPSESESQHTDVASGFQQMSLEDNNISTPTPPRGNGKHYGDGYMGRRGSSMRYKRDNRQNQQGQRFQGSFQGPNKNFNNRNSSKFHQNSNENMNAGRNYDSTPVKENLYKSHHTHIVHNSQMKRETYVVGNETPGQVTFGSNVPPFPFHLAPPTNVAIPRITPPIQDHTSSIPVGVSPHEPINEIYNSGHQYNQYNMYPQHVQTPYVHNPHAPQIHHQMPTSIWMFQPPPNQMNAQPQNQNQLNTSNVSNMSSAASNPSN